MASVTKEIEITVYKVTDLNGNDLDIEDIIVDSDGDLRITVVPAHCAHCRCDHDDY